MIGCLRTRVRKQPIIALYFESENEYKFDNLEARSPHIFCTLCISESSYFLCVWIVFPITHQLDSVSDKQLDIPSKKCFGGEKYNKVHHFVFITYILILANKIRP